MKKILLAAINAKYIHSNLAVYSLKAYADERLADVCAEGAFAGVEIEIGEYTINQQPEAVMEDIYRRKPDLLCFSCYIWNIQMIRMLLPEIRKVLPETEIWLGGPEVSYDSVQMLAHFPQVRGKEARRRTWRGSKGSPAGTAGDRWRIIPGESPWTWIKFPLSTRI